MGKIHSIRIFGSVLLGGGLATAAVLATTSCNGKPDGDKYLNI
jgi:hypothetical protein